MEDKSNSVSRQYVVFKLGKEDYGLDIQKVATIERIMPTTRVPKTPAFIKGVINLRGDIVPIMDLRSRFGLPAAPETEDTRSIILKIDDITFGIIVDEVDEVLQLTDDSIENIGNIATDLAVDYLMGVGKVNDRIVTILDVEKLAKIDEEENES
ncbi:MAG: chemotaxis protein CheW [Clostridium sp.]|jgi:purine-binding chemotaxis protein CheW|nr:chemotaxis protein CheW [Clostridium sp.]